MIQLQLLSKRFILIAAAISVLLLSGCDRNLPPEQPVVPVEQESDFTILTAQLRDGILYPYEEDSFYSFEIKSDNALKDVKVQLATDECVEASCKMNPDGVSGTITVKAKEGLEFETAIITLTVSAGHYKHSVNLTVSLAFIRLTSNAGAVSQEGGELSFNVETNIETTFQQDEDSKKFASVTKTDNTYSISIEANDSFDEREGLISINDTKECLTGSYRFSQAGSFGSRLTDSLALVKFYNDMEGWKWKERGAFEHLTKNWCTSEPLENWCGVETDSHVDLTTYKNQHDGRVVRLHMSILYKDRSLHELSEAIGELKALKRIEMDGDINGRLPKSLGTLPRLNYIWISDSEICEKLIDHPIKNIAHQIKFLTIGGDIWGPVPDWLIWSRLDYMKLSGRIPDKVCEQEDMQQLIGWGDMRGWEDTTPMSLINECIIVKAEEDGYAMWYGEEQPEGVEFVADEHEGHWRWLSTDYAWKFVKAHR